MNVSDELQHITPAQLPSVWVTQWHELPNVQGLYFVLDGEAVIYIGQSKRMRSRWSHHHRLEQVQAIPQARIAYYCFDGPKEVLLQLEAMYIERYAPILNGTLLNPPTIVHVEPLTDIKPIIVQALAARLDYQQRLGRSVPIAEVAAAAGVSRTAISNIERGKAWPSRHVTEALCNFYDITPGALFVAVE